MISTRIWLLAVVVLAIVGRAWNLSAQCLDIDEYSELQLTKLSYTEAALAADSMPPFFPVLHKAVYTLWPSDMAGRWLSLIVGVSTVWLVGTLWARAFGQVLGLMTATLLALSPLSIYYSQYIRSYGLVIFWAVLATGALAIAVRTRRRSDWLLFVVASLGGMYTHYYFALYLSVLSLAFAIHEYGWRWSRQWWISNLCLGVLALPLIGFVGRDLHFQKSLRESRPFDVASMGYTYVSMLTGYSVGPSKRDLQVMDQTKALQRAVPAAAAACVVFVCLGLAGADYLHRRNLLVLMIALSLVPVALVGLLGYVADVTFNPRFVVWSLPPLLLLLGAGALQVRRRWDARLGVVALVLLSATAVYNRHYVAGHRNEDLSGLGSYLQQGVDRYPVFVLSNYMTPGVAHYLNEEWRVLELPKVDDVAALTPPQTLTELAVDSLNKTLANDDGYWLVYTREFHGDPAGEILASLAEAGQLEMEREFAGIKLYRGQLQNH
ncbi:MAG: glycosyltransferase family 39 protein [Planctomycetota bacterium]